MSALWLWGAVALPLALALVTLADRHGRWSPLLLPVAAVPGLVAGLTGETTTSVDWLLLGTTLRTDGLARAFLVAAALLWIAAGLVAHGTLSARRRRFATLGAVALAGNVALIVAADVVTFYTGFTVMTVAAYGLVVHDRTAVARRAGRVYVLMAVVGELALLVGLVLAVHAAGTLQMAAVPAGIAGAGLRDVTIGLLLVGLGVKLGVVGLHMWLPLAHPAAPVAASAVLSGAMIKAGLLGWLRLLPLGEATMPGWGTTLLVIGLLGAFGAVAVGLTQTAAKVNLAYSSVSQMGMVVALVGVALAEPAVASAAVGAAAVFAVHHGLAKGALFLGAGAVHGRVALAGSALAAAALVGAPLTSGIAAKHLIKDVGDGGGLTGGVLVSALPLTSVATALLLTRLLWLLSQRASTSATPWAWAGWIVLVAGTALATWTVPVVRTAGVEAVAPLAASLEWEALWPLLVAGAIAVLVACRPVTVREIPAGDLIVAFEALGRPVGRSRRRSARAGTSRTIRPDPAPVAAGTLRLLDGAEGALTRWRGAMSLLVVVLVALLWGVAR